MGGMTFWGSVKIIPRRLEPNSRTKGINENHTPTQQGNVSLTNSHNKETT